MTTIKNIKLAQPNVASPTWIGEEPLWVQLNADVGGPKDYSALTIKAIYVTGIVYQICESVALLLRDLDFARQISYIPAIGLYASGIEILGRCVKGEGEHWRSSLRAGLKWLKNPLYPSFDTLQKTDTLLRTRTRNYSIDEIEFLRNYAAHGQATSQYYTIDYDILTELHPIMIKGLEEYWHQLTINEDLCDNLALANVVPLRGFPILSIILNKSTSSNAQELLIDDIFRRFTNDFRI